MVFLIQVFMNLTFESFVRDFVSFAFNDLFKHEVTQRFYKGLKGILKGQLMSPAELISEPWVYNIVIDRYIQVMNPFATNQILFQSPGESGRYDLKKKG
jgi:hypothetical protein